MPKDSVLFFEENCKSKLSNKRLLKSYLIQETHKNLIIDYVKLTYIFCTDDALLERNIQFLNHDTYTDIITFDLSEDENHLIGEIYISIDRVKENAEKFNTSYDNELHRVLFHGWLHLLGYSDKSSEKKTEMRSMEDKHINDYFTQLKKI